MHHKEYYYASPCPICGEEDINEQYMGARMGSTSWGHGMMCCSSKCGRRFKIKMNLGLVKDTSGLNNDPDDIEVMIHIKAVEWFGEEWFGEESFKKVILSKSKIALRTELRKLQHRTNEGGK